MTDSYITFIHCPNCNGYYPKNEYHFCPDTLSITSHSVTIQPTTDSLLREILDELKEIRRLLSK